MQKRKVMTEIKNKLAEVRKNKGLSQRKLAELSGLSHGHIGDLEKGRTNLNSNTVAILAKALNVQPEELKGDSLNNKVSLKLYTHKLSAGTGELPHWSDNYTLIEVDRLLLETITHINSNNLITFLVKGDSMLPKIDNNDLLLINKSINSIGYDGLYALAYNNELYVKRVQRTPENLLLHSLNPDYSLITIPLPPKEHLQIIGEVVGKFFQKL